MKKKLVCMLMAIMLAVPLGAMTAHQDFSDHWELNTKRFLIFAVDDGSFIKPVEVEKGTQISLDEYIPQKEGYTFDGWYIDPQTKETEVTEVTLNENTVIYAKWIEDGTVSLMSVESETQRIVTSNSVVFVGADSIVEVPVTDLWVQQNARLEYLMSIYNQKFN